MPIETLASLVRDSGIEWPGVSKEAPKAKAKLSYDGAKQGRLAASWTRAGGSSGNTEVGTALRVLRNRMRAERRNNPVADKAITELVEKSVGPSGILPRSLASNDKDRQIINSELKLWFESCDANGRMDYCAIQSQALTAIIESGEALLRHRYRRSEDGDRIPYKIQLLEADFLDETKEAYASKDVTTVQGIEFGPIGNRQAYWLFDNHPGESYNFTKANYQSRRIPANLVEHGFIEGTCRPGQVRGVPYASHVISSMHELGDYEEAMIVKAKVEACFVAAVQEPFEGSTDTTLGEQKQDDRRTLEGMEPGMFHYLKNGETVTFSQPTSSAGHAAFIEHLKLKIASGWKLPPFLLFGDWNNINYSSSRSGLLSFRDWVRFLQWKVLVPFIGIPVYRRIVDLLVVQGKISAADYACEWQEPAFDLLDRKIEAEADRAEVRNGSMTWGQMVERQGLDPDAQLKEHAMWAKKFRDAGLVFATDASQVTEQGQQYKPTPKEGESNSGGKKKTGTS